MYKTIHDQFQSFLDQTIEQNITTKEKKEIIKSHLLSHYQKYEEMLLYFFKEIFHSYSNELLILSKKNKVRYLIV